MNILTDPKKTEYQIGDIILFKKNGVTMVGAIKSIQGDKIEINDSTIKVMM